MAVHLQNIPLALDEEETLLKRKAAEVLGLSPEAVGAVKIIKKSVDARRKNRIHFVYALEVSLPPAEEARILRENPAARPAARPAPPPANAPPVVKEKPLRRPVVVGTGPAGLFAALTLTESGLPPLILERGREVDERVKDVETFWRQGILDGESNVQFGEGGAGTFSDGKLFTRIHDPRVARILETFVRFGGPEEIFFLQRPHVGTDRLRRVVAAIRRHLQDRGAEFRFRAKMTGLRIQSGGIRAVVVNEIEEIPVSALLLAPGNCARDTFAMLHRAGVALEPKPFAIGLRVEHPQRLIDRIQYGPSAGHPRLPPAEYMLTYRSTCGHAVYSFCMCPGGYVIGGASEPGGLVTNGMSLYRRNSPLANSALVVSVAVEEFGGSGPLAGLEFQRRWEEKAFQLGGGGFCAPAQNLPDFLKKKPSAAVNKTSFRPGVTPALLDECLPAFAARALREALPFFSRKMSGFCTSEAVLIGLETRTSSPLRILRDEDFQSPTARGLYPLGEGAGYAGGIISSALDGLKGAEAALAR